MCDGFVENITVFDEWITGGEQYRLMNPGAGPDKLQILKDGTWVNEKSHYEWGVITYRLKYVLNERVNNSL